jgi:hypothetical protein
MSLFNRNKQSAVQSFLVSLLDDNCRALRDRLDGPRVEGRVNLTIVLMVVPLERGKPVLRRAFCATTKEFSTSGVALVLDRPQDFEEVLLGFRRRGSTVWVRAKARHVHPLGGGFLQVGLRLTERLETGECPELANLAL